MPPKLSFIKDKKLKAFIIAVIILLTGTVTHVSTVKKTDKYKELPKIEENIFYKVDKVTDGDTIKIKVGNQIVTVRMIGADTPETVDPRKAVQCFGKEASNKTKEMLVGHTVRLETDPTQAKLDKYNRFLGYIYREDGVFINKYLIENGYAHEYTYGVPYNKQKEFKDAEKQAREGKLGLWGSLCS